MRTFIAIALSAECQSMLDKLQQGLRSSRADVRWTAIPSIHLSLAFLGEADPAIIPKLAESLRNAVQSEQAFSLKLAGLGCFPNIKNPRVVWCGIEGNRLLQLQKKVETICAESGFPPEDRQFRPHLTLGRVKSLSNLKPLIDSISKGSNLECNLDVQCFNIYKSVLNPRGAVYTILETIALSNAVKLKIKNATDCTD